MKTPEEVLKECGLVSFNFISADSFNICIKAMQIYADQRINQEDYKDISIIYKHAVKYIDENSILKETLSNVLLAYSKQRKEFNIPIKPQSIIDAEKILKSLK